LISTSFDGASSLFFGAWDAAAGAFGRRRRVLRESESEQRSDDGGRHGDPGTHANPRRKSGSLLEEPRTANAVDEGDGDGVEEV
jgi:hypothetical protein